MEWDYPTLLLVGAYLLVNLLAMVLYGFDKHRARIGGRRISEKKMLTMALFGPFGALAGMRWFHHKTRKTLFLLVPVFAVLHVLLFVLLLT
ncbi:MAG: DUF1294 domain-containing protein [Methanomassiliicoccales archaeon]|nr:DUF1294 domain-containing protein [Methanomassiliicoccales archaeon]